MEVVSYDPDYTDAERILLPDGSLYIEVFHGKKVYKADYSKADERTRKIMTDAGFADEIVIEVIGGYE